MRKNIQRQLHENALKPKHSNFFHKYAIFPHLRQPSDSQPHTPHSHTPSTLRLPRKAFSATRKSLFRTAKQPLPHHKTAFSATKKSLFRNTKPPFAQHKTAFPANGKQENDTSEPVFPTIRTATDSPKNLFHKKALSIFFTSVQRIFHSTQHFFHSAKRTIPHAKQTIPVMRASLSHHAIAFQYQRTRHTTVTQKHHSSIAFLIPFLRKTKTSGNKKGTA